MLGNWSTNPKVPTEKVMLSSAKYQSYCFIICFLCEKKYFLVFLAKM